MGMMSLFLILGNAGFLPSTAEGTAAKQNPKDMALKQSILDPPRDMGLGLRV